MKRPPLPYLLLLPLLALLVFGNCGFLQKVLSQRSANEILGNEMQPDQLTRLRAALVLAQQQHQAAEQRYANQPAARRTELKNIDASTRAQLADFMTSKQQRLLRQHRAKIERRLHISPYPSATY